MLHVKTALDWTQLRGKVFYLQIIFSVLSFKC